jgi:DNA-binding XRE family transcriptional regulator
LSINETNNKEGEKMSVKRFRVDFNIPAAKMAEVIGVESVGTYYKKEAGDLKFSLVEAKKITDFLNETYDLNLTIEDVFFDEQIQIEK